MAHVHSEAHAHSHAGSSETRLLVAFAFTALAMVAEAVGGWLSGSLALVADAGHMLVDAFALLLAWAGAHVAIRPPDALRSYGYARLEVLVGYTNALAQMALTGWILYEAASRLMHPEPILSGWMLAIAAGGLLINVLVLTALGGHDHDNLNIAGARLHVIGDLLGSLGAVIAALLIGALGWLWTDAVISIIVALLILNSAWRLLRRSAHVLLEGTPEDVEPQQLARTVCEETDVGDVHHVHVWQLASGKRVATLHASLPDGADVNATLVSIQRVLRERFAVSHATIQVESGGCAQDDCHDGKPHRHG